MQNDTSDKKDDDYRDDANEFGASSDFAQGRPVGNYTGAGPGQGPYTVREKGSQDWQRGVGAERASESGGGASDGGASDGRAGDGGAASGDGQVASRSADPGQSSYGGFKGEGPVPDDVQHEQAAALREGQQAGGSEGAAGGGSGTDVGGIAASDAKLGSTLPDGSGSSASQTAKSDGAGRGGS